MEFANEILSAKNALAVTLMSSALFLVSIAALYAAAGTVNLAALPERIAELPEPVQLALQLMILVTFAIKLGESAMDGSAAAWLLLTVATLGAIVCLTLFAMVFIQRWWILLIWIAIGFLV